MQYETLTDLLNNEAAAYDYFYALSPEMQTQLQQRRDIRDLRQLKQAAADIQPNNLRESQQHGSGQEPSYQGNHTIADHIVEGTHKK